MYLNTIDLKTKKLGWNNINKIKMIHVCANK